MLFWGQPLAVFFAAWVSAHFDFAARRSARVVAWKPALIGATDLKNKEKMNSLVPIILTSRAAAPVGATVIALHEVKAAGTIT